MDRQTVLSRLLQQLEAEVGVLEHMESVVTLGRLKSCCQDARCLITDSSAPSALLALARRLGGIASHPQTISPKSLLRIANSYQVLALQPWR